MKTPDTVSFLQNHILTTKRVFLYLILLVSIFSGCGSDRRPNVLLILVDTVRSDHLGCYGYDRNTTPTLDSLAHSGTRFSRVMSGSPWTLPSMTTTFTGLPERVHRARLQNTTFYGVDPSLPFLPVMMNRAGYRTAAFFNVIYMSEHFGFHRGFEHFDCQGLVELSNSRIAETTVDDFLEWLDSDEDDAPFFAAVHFFDPHATYDPPSPYDTMFADPSYSGDFGKEWGIGNDMLEANSGQISIDADGIANLINLYDGELAYTDAELGRLFAALRARDLGEETLIIVIGDHGEEFGEHGKFTHGHSLHAELLQVPIILSGSGVVAGSVDSTLSGNIDVFPTILAAAGLESPDNLTGRDLRISLSDNQRVLAASGLGESREACVRELDSKVIWNVDSDSSYMYNQALDPTEMLPLPADSALLDQVFAYWASPPDGDPGPVPWTEAVEVELRDLGYIK